MTILYTAQYNVKHQNRLDITVKGNDPKGSMFAPSWDMVNRFKKDSSYTKIKYITDYFSLLGKRSMDTGFRFRQASLRKEDLIVLVCFCPPFEFCHRYLVVHHLLKKYPEEMQYHGELFSNGNIVSPTVRSLDTLLHHFLL